MEIRKIRVKCNLCKNYTNEELSICKFTYRKITYILTGCQSCVKFKKHLITKVYGKK